MPALGGVSLTDVLPPSLGSVTSGRDPTWLTSSETSAGNPLGAIDRFDIDADAGGIASPDIEPDIEVPGVGIGGVPPGAISVGDIAIVGIAIGGIVAGGMVTG